MKKYIQWTLFVIVPVIEDTIRLFTNDTFNRFDIGLLIAIFFVYGTYSWLNKE